MQRTAITLLLVFAVGQTCAYASGSRTGALLRPRALLRRSQPLRALAADDERLASVRSLCEHVESAGGSVGALRAAAVAGQGIGLEATRAVRRGDALLGIPEDMSITAERVLLSELGPFLSEFEPELADFAFIALGLLHEERLSVQSNLAPWLQSACWPRTADVPLLWDDSAQTELAASTAADFDSRLASLKADYAWLRVNVLPAAPLLFPEDTFSFSEYRRAHALAFSRMVVLRDADGNEKPALLPLLDLPNHAEDPNCAIELLKAKPGLFGGKGTPAKAQLVASIDIAEGEPLRVRYGGSTRGELLVDYGFVPQPVPPEVALSFALDEEDMNYDDKLDVLEQAGFGSVQSFLFRERAEIPQELLAFLRLKQLSGADAFLLESIFRDVLWREHLPLPVSEENERAALEEAAQCCETTLAAFAGSLQEDLTTLAEAATDSTAYKLAAVRYAERRALESTLRSLKTSLGELSQLEYYQERRLRSLNLTPIETEEELDALRADSARVAGRSWQADDYEW